MFLAGVVRARGSSGELAGLHHRCMKQIELWTWTLRCETTGRVARSRWKMTAADAKARDPMAQSVPGTREVRDVPESPDEWSPWSTSAFGSKLRSQPENQ